jgi:periplasmic copper chaperone A
MRTTGFLACTMLLLGTCAVAAEKTSVQVSNAWVRATVPGQPVAGAYMDLRADRAVKLVGVASPVAKRGEIHEMKDDGGMMTMRGGLHVMLFGLEKPLVAGRKVKLTLEFRGDSGRVFKQTMEVPVRAVD